MALAIRPPLSAIPCFQTHHMKPLFLKFRPDNFTSHLRTPWAGSLLIHKLKAQLHLPLPPFIGESWEFSNCSELPSQCLGPYSGSLCDLLADPEQADFWLSQDHREIWGNASPLLLKYIDAGMDLSLQVHPPILAPHLHPSDSGKWEGWLILDHVPGACLYLGLAPGVTPRDLRHAMEHLDDVRTLLVPVPVKTGDFYTIPPGTVHALGAGICVLEPQIMQPGKRAVSLRLHDWNRRYDASGNLDPHGIPRHIHTDEALRYIHFDTTQDNHSAIPVHKTAYTPWCQETLHSEELEPAPCLTMRLVSGSGTVRQDAFGELTSIVVMKGEVELESMGQTLPMQAGESGIIAASAHDITFHCKNAHAAIHFCTPRRYRNTITRSTP